MKTLLEQNRITLSILGLCAAIFMGMGWQFSLYTSTSWLEYPRFLAAFTFFFLLPGFLVTKWLGVKTTFVEYLTLGLVLGMITTSVLYILLAWMKLPLLLWLWGIAGLVSFTTDKLMIERIWSSFKLAMPHHLLLLLAIFAGWLPLYFLGYYYENFSLDSSGRFTYYGLVDILLHTSIAAELTHALPPQVPFFDGVPLNYHIGMDLIPAVLNRLGGVSIPDMVVRFCPTLFITSTVLSAYCLARRFIGSGSAGVVAALLIVIGGDIVPGLLRWSDGVWSKQDFQASTITSLYLFNPMVVALSLLFTGLFCFYRSVKENCWRWNVAASMCVAALIQTKIFIFIQLAAALGLTMMINLLVFGRLLFLRQAVMISLLSLPLVVYTLLKNSGVGQFSWTWSSGIDNYILPAFSMAKLPLLVSYPALGLVAYLALTFDYRLLGFSELIKSLKPTEERSFHFFVAIFVLLGPLLSLTSKIVPRNNPDVYNNAIWFLGISKYVAVLFAVAGMLALWNRMAPVWRPVLIVLVAASLPSTFQYVIKQRAGIAKVASESTGKLDSSTIEMVAFLNQGAKSGDVAISRISDPLLALTKLHLPFFPIYIDSVSTPEEIGMRSLDMKDYWQSWDAGDARKDLLAKYHVKWVIATQSDSILRQQSVINLGELLLKLVYVNKEFIVFKVIDRRN